MATKLEKHALQLAALGSPVRLSLLRQIVAGHPEGTVVGDLQEKLAIPWSTLSHHLERLTQAGLLHARPDGRFIYYRAQFDSLRGLTDYLWEDCCQGGACAPDTCC